MLSGQLKNVQVVMLKVIVKENPIVNPTGDKVANETSNNNFTLPNYIW